MTDPEKKALAEDLTYEIEQGIRSIGKRWSDFPIGVVSESYYHLVLSQLDHINTLVWMTREEVRRGK